MLSLTRDFPGLAEQIENAARSHDALRDALVDYEHASKFINDKNTGSCDRAQWAAIRAELVVEIHRLYLQSRTRRN